MLGFLKSVSIEPGDTYLRPKEGAGEVVFWGWLGEVGVADGVSQIEEYGIDSSEL